MGIKEGGKLAIVAGAGPMGLGALTHALHCDRKPGLVVADINQDRLDRAGHLFPPAEIKAETGIDLVFANNGKMDDPVAGLREISGGTGFDDVLCYAPWPPRALVPRGRALPARQLRPHRRGLIQALRS